MFAIRILSAFSHVLEMLSPNSRAFLRVCVSILIVVRVFIFVHDYKTYIFLYITFAIC